MKKVLLSVLFLATMGMFAQETEFESPYSKGNFTIGGSINTYDSDNETEDGDTSESKGYSINPTIGYFIKDNLLIGINGRYIKVKNTRLSNQVESTNESDNYRVGVFAEKYYKIYKSFFLSLSSEFNYSNNDNEGVKSRNYNLSIAPNISCVINKHISIKVGFNNILGYSYRTYDTEFISGNSSALTTSLGDSDLSVGFRYFF
ncbi:hypothetical protein QVZ41_06295 [Wenyingzhuangia sp. chi5]|uniref:Outer membrane protein beta-barrel domain-containing protein n=1 Tax=Wenyingzhuangia gilva TaxID=3057677 RepID=A0ABT8VR62_9FLAO|nr:hypothetical protein [Wenyingzhuangia sp. chi5]MDO3694454.1 hypothetical protein [Wenyingzhuangia sp. chi5]